MGRLRSRWTVVALVPAFFLLGFAIVSSLADGADDPVPGNAPALSGTQAGAETVVLGGPEPVEPAGTGAAAPGGGEGGGSGGGDGPPAPPPGEIVVDYGRWDGMFELANPEIQPGTEQAAVVGELHYVGGLECPVGRVRVQVRLFAEGGRLVGRTEWLSTESTGEGAEVTGREPVPFEALAGVDGEPDAAALRFTAVDCL